MTKKSREKINNEKRLWGEIKRFFIIFKESSVAKKLSQIWDCALKYFHQNVFAMFFISASFTRVFFELEHHYFTLSENAPDKYDKIIVLIFSQ